MISRATERMISRAWCCRVARDVFFARAFTFRRSVVRSFCLLIIDLSLARFDLVNPPFLLRNLFQPIDNRALWPSFPRSQLLIYFFWAKISLLMSKFFWSCDCLHIFPSFFMFALYSDHQDCSKCHVLFWWSLENDRFPGSFDFAAPLECFQTCFDPHFRENLCCSCSFI